MMPMRPSVSAPPPRATSRYTRSAVVRADDGRIRSSSYRCAVSVANAVTVLPRCRIDRHAVHMTRSTPRWHGGEQQPNNAQQACGRTRSSRRCLLRRERPRRDVHARVPSRPSTPFAGRSVVPRRECCSRRAAGDPRRRGDGADRRGHSPRPNLGDQVVARRVARLPADEGRRHLRSDDPRVQARTEVGERRLQRGRDLPALAHRQPGQRHHAGERHRRHVHRHREHGAPAPARVQSDPPVLTPGVREHAAGIRPRQPAAGLR